MTYLSNVSGCTTKPTPDHDCRLPVWPRSSQPDGEWPDTLTGSGTVPWAKNASLTIKTSTSPAAKLGWTRWWKANHISSTGRVISRPSGRKTGRQSWYKFSLERRPAHRRNSGQSKWLSGWRKQPSLNIWDGQFYPAGTLRKGPVALCGNRYSRPCSGTADRRRHHRLAGKAATLGREESRNKEDPPSAGWVFPDSMRMKNPGYITTVSDTMISCSRKM